MDMSLPQQIVQACHAALEAGLKSGKKYQETTSIVLLQIKDESSLMDELDFVRSAGIPCAEFHEPYGDVGLTAFSTLPIGEDERSLFKKYSLWGRSAKGFKNPITEFVQKQAFESKSKRGD